MITDQQSGAHVDEVSAGIFRISVPVPVPQIPGGFSFNQYLVVDDQPLLFHTGPRSLFPLVKGALKTVLPPERLRWVGFSHHENDEDGAIDLWMDAAPAAAPLCGRVNAMLNADLFGRAPKALADGETLSLGQKTVSWHDAPHLPHGWDCGYLFERSTATLLCGDLFTQPGAHNAPLSTGDILGPSELMRKAMEYYAHAAGSRAALERLAALRPRLLACMHGSAWEGDGAKLLGELAGALTAQASG